MKKKIISSSITIILLVLVYLIIFAFSAEDAEQSSAISEWVTKLLYNIYYFFVGKPDSTGVIASEAISPVEGVVRKIAHFTEYGCVGLLSYNLIRMWEPQIWRGRFIILIQLFISAAIDELHQYFVPGRYASVKDVFIDVAGGITGMLLLALWMRVRKKK